MLFRSGLGAVLPVESSIMMWIGAALFAVMERRYVQRVGEFGWKLWVDSKEAVCAGLIAGWAILGIGNGIIQAQVKFPETAAEAVKLEKEAAKPTTPGNPAPPANGH